LVTMVAAEGSQGEETYRPRRCPVASIVDFEDHRYDSPDAKHPPAPAKR
jgi:hypothetical protein